MPADNRQDPNLNANQTSTPAMDESVRDNYTYNAERVLGSGSFGIVYQARVVETDDVVAIKKVYQDRRYKNRELQIMRELKHPNVVELLHAFFTAGDRQGEMFLNVVMEYCSDTVYKMMKAFNRASVELPSSLVALYSYQMLKGLAYCHSLGICHRDIKPQNLLVKNGSHELKICDFGSAKRLVRGESSVAYICSRYYRAPELIFGATEYTPAIDIWSAACVTAELCLQQPLFPGDSGVDQLVEIIKMLGTPTRSQLLAMNENYTDFRFPQIKAHPWQRVFRSQNGQDAMNYISAQLQYDPATRPTGLESLTHPYFETIKAKGCVLPQMDGEKVQGSGGALPGKLFEFTSAELASANDELRAGIIPKWYRDEQQGAASSSAQAAA